MSANYIDLAQIVLYVFWFFFAGLIYYLHQESKREGYPLDSERSDYVRPTGFPGLPSPKTFILPHGAGTATVPNSTRDTRPIAARTMEPWPGSALVPTGNPMVDGVGPAAYRRARQRAGPDRRGPCPHRAAARREPTTMSTPGNLRSAIGMPVMGADGVVAGKVSDIWVDRSEGPDPLPRSRSGATQAFCCRSILLRLTQRHGRCWLGVGASNGWSATSSCHLPTRARAVGW